MRGIGAAVWPWQLSCLLLSPAPVEAAALPMNLLALATSLRTMNGLRSRRPKTSSEWQARYPVRSRRRGRRRQRCRELRRNCRMLEAAAPDIRQYVTAPDVEPTALTSRSGTYCRACVTAARTTQHAWNRRYPTTRLGARCDAGAYRSSCTISCLSPSTVTVANAPFTSGR